jgi:hypothetical protein
MTNTRLLLKKQIKRLSNVIIGIDKIEFPLELIQISLNYQIKKTFVSDIQPMLEHISEMVKKNFSEKTGKIHFVVITKEFSNFLVEIRINIIGKQIKYESERLRLKLKTIPKTQILKMKFNYKVLTDTDLVVELMPIQLEDEYNLIKYPKEWFLQFINPLQIITKKELLDLNFNFLMY